MEEAARAAEQRFAVIQGISAMLKANSPLTLQTGPLPPPDSSQQLPPPLLAEAQATAVVADWNSWSSPSGKAEAQWEGPSGSNRLSHISQQWPAQGDTGGDWSPSGYSEAQWAGPSGSTGSDWSPSGYGEAQWAGPSGSTGSDSSPSGYIEAQWEGPSGSHLPPHNSQQWLAQGATGSHGSSSGYDEAQWVAPSGYNWSPHSSQQWLAQGSPTPAAPADHTPHGYREDIQGNHRRSEHYRAREGGGITGDKPPRHGDRGGKRNPNVIWHCEFHRVKRQAEQSGNWDALEDWKKKNPKPVKRQHR